ncbi:hypothetical protein ID850_19500 [Xenorhabdus sp. Flor]|nr:hypothetical protein [Xenorhabdus sp. Flor]MBD2816854.1 hypothetical protein [Xenorhabdus sp. Flor]
MQLRVRVRELYNQSRGAIGSRTLSHLLTNEGQTVDAGMRSAKSSAGGLR